MEKTTYFWTITQPKGNAYVMSVLFLLIGGITVGIIFAMKGTTIAIKDGEVVIKTFLYGKKIPIENIDVDGIRAVNLNLDKEYNVSIRTNGIGLPNFLSGWAKLNNGNKALVYLTDRNNVLLMPTKKYTLLFSMETPDEFIEKIKSAL
ncbi:MAG: PH domain-containing protein [Spirochaetaceae bacterium]|jgi:hypothetical protein|nr:PH domain-containing protein [Spirochaetaceae bacterium]